MQTVASAGWFALVGCWLAVLFADHSARPAPAGSSIVSAVLPLPAGLAVLVVCYSTWPAPVAPLVAAFVPGSRAWPAAAVSVDVLQASPASVLVAWPAARGSKHVNLVDPAVRTREQRLQGRGAELRR